MAAILFLLWWFRRWLLTNVLETRRKRKLATVAIVALIATVVALFFHPNQPTGAGEQPPRSARAPA